MTVLYENQRAGEFIISRMQNMYSKAVATLVSGQVVVDGDVMVLDTGKIRVLDEDTDFDTANAVTATIVGLMDGYWDSSATGTNADIVGVPYYARGIEFNEDLVQLPSNATRKAAVLAALAALNPPLIAR